ncbi:MAG TPA: CHAD domain-containing protein [Ignavibacteria bacterium]
MTNIGEITGFSKDLPLRDAMNMILISRIEDIFRYNESIFNEDDIESLHKMRVASRRLKGYLKIFNELFPKQKFNRIYNILRNFIRLIGEIRELDVSFEIIDNYLSKNTPEYNKILVLFISKLKSQKSTLREKLETDKRLIKFIKSKIDITGLVQEGFAKKQKKRFKNFNLDISFIDNPVLIIPELRKRVLRDMKVVLNHPTKKSELHELRIKAKPLRYSMELYSGFINNEFDEMISETKKFVERAGTIHDIDVLIPRLNEFAKEIKIYNNRIKKNKDKISVTPLNHFVKSLREKRKKQFVLICNTLEKWKTEDIEAKLRTFTEPVNIPPSENNSNLQQSL